MMFLSLPWEATEETGAKNFAYGCLGVGQPSLLSLQQLPVTAELYRVHVHCSWPLLLCGRAENSSQVPSFLSA